ncbi:hypothetical protein BJ912DRAFT_897077 [Pholiota molesta]|nr:hypothetical protein BJ912DRAFT_897077 [Pholiota molesta]
MPIRMLCFQPVHSKLQITLIERGEIFAHIASTLVHDVDFLRVFKKIDDLKSRFKIPRSRFFYGNTEQTVNAIDSGAEKAEQMVLKSVIQKYSRYAILSHTWLRGNSREVTYGDWIRSEFDPQQPGYRKLVNFCRTGWKDYGVALGWMDTVCINKESSAELDESIRSMYKWYQGAHVCITYLAETVAHSDMPKDTWFTRGWTLQELLAPSNIKFYNADWDKFVDSAESDKDHSIITKTITEATTITVSELKQAHRMFSIPISRRMQMAAKRQVTREEDSAYSLMGILNVSIATAYGEGAERAFSRLLQAVLNSTSNDIADIFNWAGPDHSQVSALLPSSLECYLDRSSILGQTHIQAKPVEPIMFTHLGLRITILLMPSISIENAARSPWGDYHAIADICHYPRLHFSTDVTGSYSVLDAETDRIFDNNTRDNMNQLVLGVLNVQGSHEMIRVPHLCLAVALTSIFGSLEKLATKAPVTFTFNKVRGPDTSLDDGYYIERRKLEGHGMKLDTLIL